MGRHVIDEGRPGAGRVVSSRYLLHVAVVSSALVVIASSALIASFFTQGAVRADAPSSITRVANGAPLTIALARTSGGSLEWRTYAAAAERMGAATDRPTRLRYVESRSEMTELLVSGQVDAAFLCTYCYLQVANRPGFALVAAPVIAGHAKDAAVLIVRGDSSHRTLADLRERRVAVSESTSLAGHAYLLWLCDEEGLDAAEWLDLVEGDSQEANIRSVLAGDCAATVVNRSQLASWSDADLRVVATSPEFGMPPFVTGPTIDSQTRDIMRAALIEMRPSTGAAYSAIEGFAVATDGDYRFSRVLERYTPQSEVPE